MDYLERLVTQSNRKLYIGLMFLGNWFVLEQLKSSVCATMSRQKVLDSEKSKKILNFLFFFLVVASQYKQIDCKQVLLY